MQRFVIILNTYVSFKVVFREDLLHSFGRRPDEWRGVQVVDFVEVEERGQVREHLVTDPVPGLITLLDLVDDVVRYLVVFPEIGSAKKIKIISILPKNNH